jgi:hypothetical protein
LSDFEKSWRRHYGDAPPLSFALRDAGIEHWLRFHALPESKRYPETDAEREMILERANILGRAVLGENGPCWLVQAGDWQKAAMATWDCNGAYHYDEFDWPVFAQRTTFRTGAFNALLLEIAEEVALRTLWMSESNGNVFAPYDGGFDLFLKSAEEVRFLKARLAAWLSDHPDGL